jgi:tRNA(Ile2) C34 agmatinyltransferase TiaS
MIQRLYRYATYPGPEPIVLAHVRALHETPYIKETEMEKLGVQETEVGGVSQETLEKQAMQGCPKCGGRVERHGRILTCAKCGTEPFEQGK